MGRPALLSETVTLHKAEEQLRVAHALISRSELSRDSEVVRARRILVEVGRMLDALHEQASIGLHANPPLLVWANPPRGPGLQWLSKRVYRIAYKHVDDGKDYEHPFAAGVWLATHEKAPNILTVYQHEGKPLFKDF